MHVLTSKELNRLIGLTCNTYIVKPTHGAYCKVAVLQTKSGEIIGETQNDDGNVTLVQIDPDRVNIEALKHVTCAETILRIMGSEARKNNARDGVANIS